MIKLRPAKSNIEILIKYVYLQSIISLCPTLQFDILLDQTKNPISGFEHILS